MQITVTFSLPQPKQNEQLGMRKKNRKRKKKGDWNSVFLSAGVSSSIRENVYSF